MEMKSYTLIKEVRSLTDKNKVLGIAGSKVLLVEAKGKVALVENESGIRFPTQLNNLK
jgi:hypothetical protein